MSLFWLVVLHRSVPYNGCWVQLPPFLLWGAKVIAPLGKTRKGWRQGALTLILRGISQKGHNVWACVRPCSTECTLHSKLGLWIIYSWFWSRFSTLVQGDTSRWFKPPGWHHNKSSVLVHGPHTKTELLSGCQWEVGNNVNGHPEVYMDICAFGNLQFQAHIL